MLCEQCNAAFGNANIHRIPFLKARAVPGSELQVLHSQWASLKEALEAGCRFCHQLVHAAQNQVSRSGSKVFTGLELQSDLDLESFTMKYRLAYETESKRVISCLCVCEATRLGKAFQEKFTEFMFLSTDQSSLEFMPLEESRTGTDPASIGIIESWIDRCINNHSRCRQRHTSLFGNRFARILDVGSLPGALEVNLVLSKGLPDSVRYVTLSHCWGGADSQIPCLTSVNYDDFCRRIVVASLPKTFQDAIHLARCLKVQYLWIDSLCIIQDSEQDWLEQSAIMGEIYLGSYLNVAASRSRDPSGGLFCQRNPFLITPLRIGITGANAPREASSQQRDTERRRCTLEHTTMLTVATPQLPVTFNERQFYKLDDLLGNHNGQFSMAGKNFSLSARNVQIHDNSLRAELRTVHGQWNHSEFNLRELSEVIGKRPDSTQSFELEGSSTLVRKSPSRHTVWQKKQVDLNLHLGNRNGKFCRSGTNFGHSAKDVELSGMVLSGDLRTVSGEWLRDSIDISPLLDQLEHTEDVTQAKPATPQSRFYDVAADHYANWSFDVARANLCSRGWVLQERLLAPRVVHFAKQQMYFECVESRSLERYPEIEIDCRQPAARDTRMDFKAWDVFSPDLIVEPEPKPLSINYVWSSVKAMFGRAHVEFRKDEFSKDKNIFAEARRMCYGDESWMPTHPLIKYWSAILTTYFPTNLTYEEDRLLAIAGLARVLSERTGARYIAGLWRYQLSRQLLWNNYKHGDNHERRARYIAPSWSPASCSAFLGGRGIGLHPMLESKGAMDLIKVVTVDVKAVSLPDDPPFGRLQDGRLRLRGRLLPIFLNLDMWPGGENRQDHLVQYWAGQTTQRPTGTTFVVPVLFTRWSPKLPSSTANSLLLESTKETGVFQRIGVARLSSRCPLKEIVPQLYAAHSRLYEDEDDDADTDGELEQEDLDPSPLSAMSPKVPPNAQQELADKRRALVSNPTLSKQLGNLQKRFNEKHAGSDSKDENSQGYRNVANKLSLVQSALKFVQAEASGKSEKKIHVNKQEMQEAMKKELGYEVTVVTRNNMWTQYPREPVTMIQPKAAVGEHFYIRYEDDQDTSRYGHFVFDVI